VAKRQQRPAAWCSNPDNQRDKKKLVLRKRRRRNKHMEFLKNSIKH